MKEFIVDLTIIIIMLQSCKLLSSNESYWLFHYWVSLLISFNFFSLQGLTLIIVIHGVTVFKAKDLH